MIGTDQGARLIPRIAYQQNADQVDFTWELDVPGKWQAAIVHFQVARPNFTDAAAFWDATRDKDLSADIPADLTRIVLNFPHPEKLVNDMEVLRGAWRTRAHRLSWSRTFTAPSARSTSLSSTTAPAA